MATSLDQAIAIATSSAYGEGCTRMLELCESWEALLTERIHEMMDESAVQ